MDRLLSTSPPSAAFFAIRLFAVCLVALQLFFSPLHAHQSISFPYPISRDTACRIGLNGIPGNCPGPCPTKHIREDMTPNNPSVTVRRGSWLVVHVMANNHRGGFSRWSIVPIRHMYNRGKHTKNAFLFTCGDVGLTKCESWNRKRDCNYDQRNEYYRHRVQIPRVIPDGKYVLGWVWYGGGSKWGHFGDYYDCIYIEVKGGGGVQQRHQPIFRPGNSPSSEKGMCRATVNKIGVCWGEPCPGGGSFTQMYKPYEFENGRQPAPITRDQFSGFSDRSSSEKSESLIKTMSIRSSVNPSVIYINSKAGRFRKIRLTQGMRPTVTCEVTKPVKYVAFYINGRRGRVDYDSPYSIAGDYQDWKTKAVKFAPWKFSFGRTTLTVSCRAVGFHGTEDWKTMELSTYA